MGSVWPASGRGVRSVRLSAVLLLLLGVGQTNSAWGADQAYTVLADFEDASVAAQLTDVRQVLAADCKLTTTQIPARGQGALALEIGATAPRVSVACDLTFREPMRFPELDRVALFCWVRDAEIRIAFRLRDARGQLYETELQSVKEKLRWAQVGVAIGAAQLKRLTGTQPFADPLQVQGFRVETTALGRQTVYLDDLQVVHQVSPQHLVHGTFDFDEPTRVYEPGAPIRAAVVLENRSRTAHLTVTVDLAWTRPDGSSLQAQRDLVNLPPSGVDFRSHRKLDFSQVIQSPGLYRLVARAQAPGWPASNTFATTIAVTPSNRRVPRGRSVFFGVRSNLLREPQLDQMLEIRVARDMGVNLLAVDVPWRLAEPKAQAYDFAPLQPLVTALTERDIAPLAVLTEPPIWAAGDRAAREIELIRLLEALIAKFGERVPQYQLDAELFGDVPIDSMLASTERVRAAIRAAHPRVEVLPPAVHVHEAAPALDVAELLKRDPEFPLVFQTCGDTLPCLAQLEAYRQRAGFEWKASHFWQHDAAPIVGAGEFADAEGVLRHFVSAAVAGVGGLIWHDLRDDDNDLASPNAWDGLLRRDFSPKTSMLGYTTIAGLLTGYRCAGPVRGAPPEFDSALFISANRQIMALLPKPHRVLPAVLSPVADAMGDFSAYDFERRPHALLMPGENAALVPVLPRPLFIALATKRAESEPQVRLTTPWLRVPGTLFCGRDTSFSIEIDAFRRLNRSYLQLQTPKDAPYDASLSAASLTAELGETVAEAVQLSPRAGRDFARSTLELRLSIQGSRFELPIEVCSLADIRSLARGNAVTDEAYRLGRLSAPAGARATATAELHAAFTAEQMQLAVVVEDDRFTPLRAESAGALAGDQLLIRLAKADSPVRLGVRLEPAQLGSQAPRALGTTNTQAATEWNCVGAARADGSRAFTLTIPAAALHEAALAAGQKLLLNVQYIDDDADGFPPAELSWSSASGGEPAERLRWARLAGADGKALAAGELGAKEKGDPD